jgi:beta-mannosidase
MIFNTTLPTVLHLDLMRASKIKDPFFGNNHEEMKWISLCNVTYTKNLSFGNGGNGSYELVFEGIDTYSTVVFNKKELLTTNNSFVEYRVRLNNSDIKFGENNLLEVHIYSTSSFDKDGQQKRPMPFAYAQTRKAAYQYSWDWAPDLNTMGIWKDVYVVAYDELIVDYVWVRIRSLEKEEAVLNFAIALRSSSGKVFASYSIEISADGVVLATEKVSEL